MKFTFVQPPFKNYAVVNPPMGLAYLASVLKNVSDPPEVSVVDANAERLNPEETAERIVASSPQAVGFTMTSPQYEACLKIIRLVKARKDIPVIVGGPHPTVMPGELLNNPGVDILVRSEGEDTIVDLHEYFRGKRELSAIGGISYRQNGRIVSNADRPLIENLDRIPFPAWELFPLSRYTSIAGKYGYALPVMSSRGCPFGCTFCYKGVFGRTYRARTPENVVAEIERLAADFKIREFVILDDNFALKEDRALAICDLLIRKKIRLPWRLSNSIAVKNSSSRLFHKLKEAGCYQVSIGVESGNQEILDGINKGIKLAEIENTFRLTREAGLETIAFFMIGNLGENEATIDDTIRFAKRIRPDFAQFTIATPYPGTGMYEQVKREGRLLFKSWEELASYGAKGAFCHGALNPELMERKYRQAYSSFYLRPGYAFKRLMRTLFAPGGFRNTLKGIRVFCGMIAKKKS
jgi:anaerobic magnesium-protoporphyrin IX monomethyl ester cyclase